MGEFIKSNMRYPEEAMKNLVQVRWLWIMIRMFLAMSFSQKSSMDLATDATKKLCAVSETSQVEKHVYKGMRVVFHRTINIHFQIHEAAKIPPAEQTVNYTVKKEDNPEQPKQNIINILTNFEPPK
ncbi:MAG: hypothetical protein U0X76_13295 [Bacteroidia bacterium]